MSIFFGFIGKFYLKRKKYYNFLVKIAQFEVVNKNF